jgi:peroxin-5
MGFNISATNHIAPVNDTRQQQLKFEAQPAPQFGPSHTPEGLVWASEFSNGNFGIKWATVSQRQLYRSEQQDNHAFQKRDVGIRGACGQSNLQHNMPHKGRYDHSSITSLERLRLKPGIGMDWTCASRTLSCQTQLPSAVLEETMEDFDWEALFSSLDAATQKADVNTDSNSSLALESGVMLDTLVGDEKRLSAAHPTPREPSISAEEGLYRGSHTAFEKGMEIVHLNDNLSLAVLAFEEACRANPVHFEAWRMLGSVLAEVEREPAAIQAFKEALKLEPSNIDIMMRLAVSYTNEGDHESACLCLEQWLKIKYPQVPIPEPDRQTTCPSDAQLLGRIKEPFIQAARLSLEEESIDPDVQVGLGVLMFASELYGMAADCFYAAIQSTEPTTYQTHQHLLWNRYAACLGNIRQKETMAIQAYEMALNLKPNFVKARYNLGVLYHNINQPLMGAKSILEALLWNEVAGSTVTNDIHEMTDAPKIQDDAMDMYETLRKCCNSMCRWDLAELVGPHMDVQQFKMVLDTC